jgi:hypothetical protein
VCVRAVSVCVRARSVVRVDGGAAVQAVEVVAAMKEGGGGGGGGDGGGDGGGSGGRGGVGGWRGRLMMVGEAGWADA